MYIDEKTKYNCKNTKKPSITNPRTAAFFDLRQMVPANSKFPKDKNGYRYKEFDIT